MGMLLCCEVCKLSCDFEIMGHIRSVFSLMFNAAQALRLLRAYSSSGRSLGNAQTMDAIRRKVQKQGSIPDILVEMALAMLSQVSVGSPNKPGVANPSPSFNRVPILDVFTPRGAIVLAATEQSALCKLREKAGNRKSSVLSFFNTPDGFRLRCVQV